MYCRIAGAALCASLSVVGHSARAGEQARPDVAATTPAITLPPAYGVKAGKPYRGQSIKIMAVNTPQFVALQMRTQQFTDATGINVKWVFVPFKPLQEKVTSVGVAANGNWADFVRGAGGRILDAKGYPAWTSPQARQATRDYIALYTKRSLCGPGATSNVEQDARISFQQGHAAMLPIWQWSYAAVTNPKDSTLKPEQVGFAPMPAYKAGAAPTKGDAEPMPEVVFWPEVADLASVAISRAATGSDVDAVMEDAAERAHRVVERALR